MSEEKKGSTPDSATPYDDAFRTMETKCDDLLIPFVNHIFGENYDKGAVINRLRNEEYIEHKDKSLEKRITDSSFEIRYEDAVKRYHLECESSRYDESILIRIFEYDSQIARADSEGDRYKVRFRFPNSGLLILRRSRNTPEAAVIELEMPDGKETSYEIPVLRMWDYSIDDIFENKLYMLIPFYIFNYEGKLKSIDDSDEKTEQLIDEYKRIIARLKKENDNGNLSSVSVSVIIKLIHRVAYNLTKNRKKINEKVGDFMGGQVLDLPKAEGRIEGRVEGRVEGRAEERTVGIRIFIEDKIEDGIPEDRIIEKLTKRYGMTSDEARDHIQECRSVKTVK